MSPPLAFLEAGTIPSTSALGDAIGQRLSSSSSPIRTLLDCLCASTDPAIYAPDISRPPLAHQELRSFVANFSLPHSSRYARLGRNDRIMVVLPSGPENAVALLAMSTYHSCAPINANCTTAELLDDALRLRARAIVTTVDVAKKLDVGTLEAELGCDIILLHKRTSGSAGLFDLTLLHDTSTSGSFQPSEPHTLDDVSLILHTSGTSGKKKVVRYSLRTLIVGTWCVVQSWDLKPNDINMNMMPLFHVGGIVRNLLAPVLSGGAAVMCLGFDSNAFWTLSKELKATWYYAAPTVHHAILSSQPEDVVPSRDLRIRMICNAAGGLLPSLALQLKGTFLGAAVLPSYGMTECMPIATPPTNYNLERPGCSGRACGPGLSIRHPLDLERELPPGSSGAVCVRGLPMFEGYEMSPDLSIPLDTSAFSSEGWFDSGDVGHMDEDGYLYITGRSKEIINKGGEVVSPFEVEEAIAITAKEWVKTVLAFSIEHDVLQETIGVVIVPRPDKPLLSLQQLHDQLKGHLHPSKWPFAVVYMADLPKNSAGKPLRINLAKRFGIGKLTDAVPALHRHFQAVVPSPTAPLSEPIPCTKVIFDVEDVDRALRSIPEVNDIGLQSRPDGNVDAYVSLVSGSSLKQCDILQILSGLIPGFALPGRVEVFSGPLPRRLSGEIDFEQLVTIINKAHTSVMSKREEIVRDIFADLLQIDTGRIQSTSDFFLLGGNSLLLGKLSHQIRKKTSINIGIAELFSDSTVQAIASVIQEREVVKKPSMRSMDSYDDEKAVGKDSRSSSRTEFGIDYDYDMDMEQSEKKARRGQNHPISLIVQALPFIFFYPLKAAITWSMLLFILSYLSNLTRGSFWDRMVALLTAIIAARGFTRTVCPLMSIAFKWVVIGRYQAGTYPMWSNYHLRWWMVNQYLRINGRGVFSMHPKLTLLYYRLLGTKIGRNVILDEETKLLEFDLITIEDGCRIDTACVRAFCVEREGMFRLEPIHIGTKAVINCYTTLEPGSRIPDGAVYGPHASSFDDPHPRSYAAYNSTLREEPYFLLKLLVAWPIILVVKFIAHIPWMLAIYGMINTTHISREGLNNMESVIHWFADGERVIFHGLARVLRAIFRPTIQVMLGILVKRALGLNPGDCDGNSQFVLLRRYINSSLLSRQNLKDLFSIFGTHYEFVSVVFRAMGAKVGKRVYWPGSGVKCPDPELLEIGDDVVFGSRSHLMTSDRMGSAKIVVEDGAMIADRVVLLPGTTIGRRAVMGSGALSKRNTSYDAGSTWIGNDKGEAVCLNRGDEKQADMETVTPFGRAFYQRKAEYFVYPYPLVALLGVVVTAFSAAYWSISAVAAAQMLRQLHIHLQDLALFEPRWYLFALFYGLIAGAFVVALTTQGIIAIMWVIVTKWLVIGKRKEGRYDWDQSSYCQRWQVHLVLSRFMYKGFGNGGVLSSLNGSAYVVWFYRAQGAKIGKNCSIWAGGKGGLMTEPDLIELGDNVNLDECSVVAHINSRGRFSLNKLKIANDCALRSGSRLLSGASMEENSMLCEHTLLTSGEIADEHSTYAGWPGKKLEKRRGSAAEEGDEPLGKSTPFASLVCPACRKFPKDSVVTKCGHLFCNTCISQKLSVRKCCPVCAESVSSKDLKKVHLSFTIPSISNASSSTIELEK